MERLSIKEAVFDPVQHSKIIAEHKLSALSEIPHVHQVLETDGLAPLFNLLAGQLVGIFGII